MSRAELEADMFVKGGLDPGLDANVVAITYHPDGGSDVAINGQCIPKGGSREEQTPGGRKDVWDAELRIATDAVNGIVSPAEADEVTIGGERWAVTGTPNVVGGCWVMGLYRSSPRDVSPSRFVMA